MRPYVICNMIQSLDGRTKADGCPEEFYHIYKGIEDDHKADGWMCGRITMEDFIGSKKYKKKIASKKIPKTDYKAAHDKKLFGIVLDTQGRLLWNTNTINDAHIVVALTEKASDDYLEFLQSMKISYIFCGKDKINLKTVLEKLVKKFKIKKILLQGGGKMNASMLREGYIDELSMLVGPVIEGTIGTPTIFDVNKTRQPAYMLKLLSMKKLKKDILLLNYMVLNEPQKKAAKK